MVIDVYADVVCPWCYIGERRLERALRQRPDLQVERRWRPFQLQPGMPRAGLPWSDFARRKFGGVERARSAFAQVTAAGANEGITFAFDRVATAPNTVDAHRLILFGGQHGREWETAEGLFAAYFAEGRNLNDVDDLVAVKSGLDADEARAYLASSEGVDEVYASQEEAGRLGIEGVPFYVFDGRYGLSGAQPLEVFLRALDLAQAEPALG
jgi:predicted DsbA family dithiol-disulfide isomerase